jgi:histidine triad (HIT) family protein
MTDCIFCRIIKKEIPGSIVYEDEKILAFNDIAPQAPSHILVIPKQHIVSVTEIKDDLLIGDLFKVVNKLAAERGIDKTGFRVVVNHGKAAGQAVEHLHFHLLGGRDLSWPPG